MLKIEINPRDLVEIEAALTARPHQANRALVRAINKTLSWARAKGVRAIADEYGLPLKSMRRRGAVRRAGLRNLSGVAWFGTSPIKAVAFGRPRQTPAGARAGSRLFSGAFVATVETGVGSVYRRLGEPVPAGFKASRGHGGHIGIFRREGRSRLPIKSEYVRLTAAKGAIEGVAAQLADRLQTTFQQEMNYEVNVRGKV